MSDPPPRVEQALPAARPHLVLALDVPTIDEALRIARSVGDVFGVAKVGLELFSGAGPGAVEAIKAEGFDVFCDLKLHDIPTTVGRAARRLAALGPRYLTVHAAGGPAMLAAAVEGFAEGAPAGDHGAGILGVTVLTSDREAPPEVLAERAALAASSGCVGVVCAAADLAVVAAAVPRMQRAVPGIRPAGAGADDQARVATPGEAIRSGATLLVVGRAVTRAADPAGVARQIAEEVASALADTAASGGP